LRVLNVADYIVYDSDHIVKGNRINKVWLMDYSNGRSYPKITLLIDLTKDVESYFTPGSYYKYSRDNIYFGLIKKDKDDKLFLRLFTIGILLQNYTYVDFEIKGSVVIPKYNAYLFKINNTLYYTFESLNLRTEKTEKAFITISRINEMEKKVEVMGKYIYPCPPDMGCIR